MMQYYGGEEGWETEHVIDDDGEDVQCDNVTESNLYLRGLD